MPPRTNPTARQERLGAELRKIREHAGMTAREAAKLLGSNPIQMSHVESGRSGISEERIRRLAAYYDCGDAPLVDALVDMAQPRDRGWWEGYRGILPAPLLDLSELEHHAGHIRAIQVTHIPGAFQTEDYARTVFGHTIPALPATDLEARVAHRMQRRDFFLLDNAPTYEAVIHEAALRMRFGSRKILRAQLDYLQEVSERPNITLRVIPFEAEGYIGSGHAMVYVYGQVPQLDTVQIEAEHAVTLLDAAAHLAKYRTIFDAVKAVTLGETESRGFIQSVAQQL